MDSTKNCLMYVKKIIIKNKSGVGKFFNAISTDKRGRKITPLCHTISKQFTRCI